MRPPWRASAGEWTTRSLPRTAIRPASGRMAPVRILTRVLFPAPFAPISAWTSPGRTASDAALSATTAPYVLRRPVASSSRSVAVRVMTPRGMHGGRRRSRRPPFWVLERLLARPLAGDGLIGGVGRPALDLKAQRPQRIEAIDLPRVERRLAL